MHFDLKNTQERHVEMNEVIVCFVHMVSTKDSTDNQKHEASYSLEEIQKFEDMVSYSIKEWAFYLSDMRQFEKHMTKMIMED